MKTALCLAVTAAALFVLCIFVSSFTHHDIMAHAAAAMPHVSPMTAMLFGAPMARRRHPGLIFARADASMSEVMGLLNGVQKAFDDFKVANDARVAALEKGRGDVLNEDKVNRINAELSELSQKIANLGINGNGSRNVLSADGLAHAKAFNAYFRKGIEAGLGELQVKAALTTSSDPDGGYVAPAEVDLQITRILQKITAMRSIARVITISGGEYKKPTSQGGAQSGWVGQQTARTTTNTPTLTMETFKAFELYAQPAASQTLLDDAAVDIGAWLSEEVTITFAEQEGQAFITGDGVVQPYGILSYPTANDTGSGVAWGKLGFVKTTAAADFSATPFDNLVDLQSMLKTGYQANANWLMNRFVQAEVRKVKDSQNRYIWDPALQAGSLPTVFGKPVVTDDNMPNAGANNFFVAYGDFMRGYLIVDRIGVRVIRDNLTNKPNVLFYTTKRVGGGVQNYEAIKLLKCST
jgi:HK97 family phage major capsid protein